MLQWWESVTTWQFVKFLQNSTAVLIRKSKSVEENFAQSKCYCLGKEIGFGFGFGSRALRGHKRQCSLLHSATFTPKGWWGAWITVCFPGQPAQGDLMNSCSAVTSSQGRGRCMNITPVTYMRTDNARKTWGHSGQLDVYWLPARVLNYVTENMDLKCAPKSREMSSKNITRAKWEIHWLSSKVVSPQTQSYPLAGWVGRVSPDSTDVLWCFSNTSFLHTMSYKKCFFTTKTWKVERWGWTSVSHSVERWVCIKLRRSIFSPALRLQEVWRPQFAWAFLTLWTLM